MTTRDLHLSVGLDWDTYRCDLLSEGHCVFQRSQSPSLGQKLHDPGFYIPRKDPILVLPMQPETPAFSSVTRLTSLE
jgi:hypothetical protein